MELHSFAQNYKVIALFLTNQSQVVFSWIWSQISSKMYLRTIVIDF